MLTAYLPTALAVLGTVLMAVVIFAPVPGPATVTMSFAPPLAPPSAPRSEYSGDQLPEAWMGFPPSGAARERAPGRAPRWPVLIDPAALDCDVAARLELVAALRSVRAPWAEEILRCALEDEHDDAVREAIVLAERRACVTGARRYAEGLA
jgi:hypothetical protein